MKEQIKQIIQNSVNFHFKCEDGTTYWYLYDKEIDDLAARLDKAIEIDKERVRNIIKDNARDYLLHGNFVVKVGELSKAIAQSRPLKCEVES